jgi:hypothetical protein
MPTFPSNTVHGLSADVYFKGVAVRVLGDVTINIEPEVLELTANDEGAFNPVDVFRRGDSVTVGIPVADTMGLDTLSGVLLPFGTLTVISGAVSGIALPKPVPGQSLLSKAGELRLVARDGSATWVFPSGVCFALEELAMSEENQQVWAATFRCFNATISGGVVTPFYVLSGSYTTGPV